MPARDSERTSLRASDNSDTSRTNRRSSCNRRACNSADGASKAKPALPSRAWEAASHASTPAAPLCHHGPGCFGRAAGWSGVRWHTPPLCGARPRGVTSRTRCSEPRPLRHRAHLTRLLLPIKLPAVCMHRASRRSEDDWSGGRSVLEVGRSIDRSPERLNWILAAAAQPRQAKTARTALPSLTVWPASAPAPDSACAVALAGAGPLPDGGPMAPLRFCLFLVPRNEGCALPRKSGSS